MYENGKKFNTDPKNLSDSDQQYLAIQNRIKNTAQNSAKGVSVNVLKAKERKLIFAKDILALYQGVVANGQIGVNNAVFVENKIKQFEVLAANDSVDFEGEFVPRADIQVRREKASKLVESWIGLARKSSDEINVLDLREATDIDPIATEAVILEGLTEYFAHRDYSGAMRKFKDAVRRGEKYEAINTDVDRQNLQISLNACAILATKSRNLNMAFNYWTEASKLKTPQSDEVIQNIKRFAAIARPGNAGIYLSKSDQKKFNTMHAAFNVGANGSGKGGWNFSNPIRADGQPHAQLGFLAKKFEGGVQDNTSSLLDFVCLVCDGVGHAECPFESCQRGLVEKRRKEFIILNNGQRVPNIVHFKETCPTCSGKGSVRCWGCAGSGKQD